MGKTAFVKCVLGLFALCVIMAGPAAVNQAFSGEKTYNWKLVTCWPPKYPPMQEILDRFCKEVDIMSQGRLKITHYPGGTLIPPLEVFEAVRSGMAQMGSSATYYWAGKVPEAPLFTTIPFGMTTEERMSWLYCGGGMELWREVYAPYNLVPFPHMPTGVQMAGWFNKEINSVADLKGIKIRIPGVGGKVMKKVGANVVLLPYSEIFVSLERGVIDAVEMTGPYHDERSALYQAAKYYYYPGWQEPSTVTELIVHKQAWDSLPDDLKLIVERANNYVFTYCLAEMRDKNAESLQSLKKKGVDVRSLPDDVVAELKKQTQVVMEELAAEHAGFKKVYDSFKNYQEKQAEFTAITDEAFLKARSK